MAQLKRATQKHITFNSQEITIESAAPRKTFNVLSRLREPEGFYGDPNVHHLIEFGGAFEQLIGKDKGGEWSEDARKLFERDIIVGEYWRPKLIEPVLNEIAELARKIIEKPELYDSKVFCENYLKAANEGYSLLRKIGGCLNCDVDENIIPVSLERGGLVSTRLARGLDKDEVIDNEIRVVTKRIHLNEQPETHLAATVKWRDLEKVRSINDQVIEVNDFVNPASGASAMAFILAAKEHRFVPKKVIFRAIEATRQGIIFMKKELTKLGIESVFLTLGESDEMNDQYYLIGHNKKDLLRIVADAGHVLRHFLPNWYKA